MSSLSLDRADCLHRPDTLTSPIYREETSVVNHQAALEGGDEKNTFCITEGQKSGAGDVDSDELNTVSTHR